MTKIFQENAPQYWSKGMSVVPVPPGTKRSIEGWTHYANSPPSHKTRDEWLQKYASDGVSLMTGAVLVDNTRLVAIDVDSDPYVAAVTNVVGPIVSAKKGAKGITIFVRSDAEVKSSFAPSKGARIVDILASGKHTLLPPTIHPETRYSYVWVGASLLDIDIMELPYVSKEKIEALKVMLNSEHHQQIMAGRGTHDAGVPLMAQMARKVSDMKTACEVVEAFLPEDYTGNLHDELEELFTSAKEKGFSASKKKSVYDPGNIGPIPMGYLDATGIYVFQHQQKKVLAVVSAQTLMSEAGLTDLAPRAFWLENFEKFSIKGEPTGQIDAKHVGDVLMQRCREAGPFDVSRVLGVGAWLDKGRIVQNLRGDIPVSNDRTYIRFLPLPPLRDDAAVDAARVLELMNLFQWESPEFPMLLLGWAAVAPLCGALEWRTHVFVGGPKNSGKSTLIEGLSNLLEPMGIVVDGSSTEAGIRQKLGADARPVILDEFESDGDPVRMKKVVKLVRSASSAKGPVARGTPEGKALQFQLYSSFLFGAINPMKGTAADASRIVNLMLIKHNNDLAVKAQIDSGLAYLMETKTAWTHQVIEVAETMARMRPTVSRSRKRLFIWASILTRQASMLRTSIAV